MNANRRLWIGLGALLAISFSVLLWIGTEIHRVMPPIPARWFPTTAGAHPRRHRGRQVWQSIGGHQLGSIWGHGSYVAPDWSADWLHREATAWLDAESRARHSVAWADLGDDDKAAAIARLTPRIRHNGYDKASDTVTVDNGRAAAMHTVESHYVALFGDDPALHELRKAYAMKEGTVLDADNRRALTACIWWSAWASVFKDTATTEIYTNNWPSSRWWAIRRRLTC
jgi:nitric oxide reductase subunit B